MTSKKLGAYRERLRSYAKEAVSYPSHPSEIAKELQKEGLDRARAAFREMMQDDGDRAADPWANRSEGMRCKTCMWFAPKKDDIGRCRRHAPTMSGYPVVYASSDFCGDHKLDENK